MLQQFVKAMPEYVQAADTIADCGVDYTLLRCCNLIDGNDVSYDITHEGDVIGKDYVSRKAVAKFIADVITGAYPDEKNASLGITQ